MLPLPCKDNTYQPSKWRKEDEVRESGRIWVKRSTVRRVVVMILLMVVVIPRRV